MKASSPASGLQKPCRWVDSIMIGVIIKVTGFITSGSELLARMKLRWDLRSQVNWSHSLWSHVSDVFAHVNRFQRRRFMPSGWQSWNVRWKVIAVKEEKLHDKTSFLAKSTWFGMHVTILIHFHRGESILNERPRFSEVVVRERPNSDEVVDSNNNFSRKGRNRVTTRNPCFSSVSCSNLSWSQILFNSNRNSIMIPHNIQLQPR